MPTTSASLARPGWLTPEVWPFDTRTIESDGVAIAVTDVGTGPTLLFVHTGMWSFVWRDLLVRLSDEFRCVAFDAPGTGRSGRPGRRGTTLAAAARATGAVVDQLDLDDITLVLHDLGGLAGLAAVADRPERVRAIAAINTFGWRPTGTGLPGHAGLDGQRADARARRADKLAPALLPLPPLASAATSTRPADAPSAGIDRPARRSFHRYMHDARNPDAVIEDVRRPSWLSGVGRFSQSSARRTTHCTFNPNGKSQFANTRQVVVPDGHHFPMCDDPDLVAHSIRTWVSQPR